MSDDPKPKVVTTNVRIPGDMHSAITRVAKQESRSMHGEIIHRLRRSLRDQQPKEVRDAIDTFPRDTQREPTT
jgi:hypothetical protein